MRARFLRWRCNDVIWGGRMGTLVVFVSLFLDTRDAELAVSGTGGGQEFRGPCRRLGGRWHLRRCA
jgi:hypothetical protein